MPPDNDPWSRLARAARAALPAPPPEGPAAWRTRAARSPRADAPEAAHPWARMLPHALAVAAVLALACAALAWRAGGEALPSLALGGGWP